MRKADSVLWQWFTSEISVPDLRVRDRIQHIALGAILLHASGRVICREGERTEERVIRGIFNAKNTDFTDCTNAKKVIKEHIFAQYFDELGVNIDIYHCWEMLSFQDSKEEKYYEKAYYTVCVAEIILTVESIDDEDDQEFIDEY